MAKTKRRSSKKQKLSLVHMVLIAVAVIAGFLTITSPSADKKRTIPSSTTTKTTTTSKTAPSISSIYPSTAKIGDTVSLRGRDFQPGTTVIYMGDGVVTNYLASSNNSTLNFYVPDTTCRPPVGSSCKGITVNPGTYKVYVKDFDGRKSNEVSLTVRKR